MSDIDTALEREWLAAEAEWAKEQACMQEHFEHVKAQNDAWKAKWPHHCKNCGGWGMFITRGVYSGPPEHCYPDECDPCDAIPDGMCHRCRAMNYTVDQGYGYGDRKCPACGWRFDDGLAEF